VSDPRLPFGDPVSRQASTGATGWANSDAKERAELMPRKEHDRGNLHRIGNID
jgi:hypothetical protein